MLSFFLICGTSSSSTVVLLIYLLVEHRLSLVEARFGGG